MNTAVIGLGSNINPQDNIRKAWTFLSAKFTILAESKLIRTKPVGFPDQEDFINGTVLIETPLDCSQLKTALQEIEETLGRRKPSSSGSHTADLKTTFGPRTIDLDILVWNNQVVDQDFYSRDFLQKLVLSLLPDLPH